MDTSIYLALLGVPNHSSPEWTKELNTELIDLYKNGDTIIIPLGTVVETGNIISRAVNGRRYQIIKRFLTNINMAINENAPYKIGELGNKDQLREWLTLYEEMASPELQFGDILCIQEFNKLVDIFPNKAIDIWSDDSHLQSYKNIP